MGYEYERKVPENQNGKIIELAEKIASEIRTLSPAEQIEFLTMLKKILCETHATELASHEKRTAELKELMAAIKGV